MPTCRTCDLVSRRDRGEAPAWDCIVRTAYWDVVHSFDTSLPGWLVLVARRHVASVRELTEAEAIECGRLQREVSIALRTAVGCKKTYVAQFAESPEHPHVHFHIIPRMDDLAEDARGPDVFRRHLGVPVHERVPEEHMNAIAVSVRESLSIRG